MANALLLPVFAIILCIIAKSSVNGLLCFGGSGSIDNAVSLSSNRTCTQTNIQVNDVTYNVSWAGGSYSLITVDLTINSLLGSIETQASGRVVSGKYANQLATLELQFVDTSGACVSTNGTSQLTGTASINIPVIPPIFPIFGEKSSISCAGNATLNFSPPLNSVITPITSSLNVDFFGCFGVGRCP